jgi:hypothetical protein
MRRGEELALKRSTHIHLLRAEQLLMVLSVLRKKRTQLMPKKISQRPRLMTIHEMY